MNISPLAKKRILSLKLTIVFLLLIASSGQTLLLAETSSSQLQMASGSSAKATDSLILHQPEPELHWLDITKTIIGSFAGATFAFMFAFWMHNRQRRRENKAAGNLAMATLARQLNDFIIYKRGIRESHQEMLKAHPKAPPWLQLKPIHYTFSGPLKFDIESLAFLFEKGNPAFLADIMIAEARYHDLLSSSEKLNLTLDEAQNKLAAGGLAANGVRRLNELEEILGPALVAKANAFVEGMLRTVAEDQDIYVKATKALRAKLIEYFGEGETGIIMGQLPPEAEVVPAADAGEANARAPAPGG